MCDSGYHDLFSISFRSHIPLIVILRYHQQNMSLRYCLYHRKLPRKCWRFFASFPWRLSERWSHVSQKWWMMPTTTRWPRNCGQWEKKKSAHNGLKTYVFLTLYVLKAFFTEGMDSWILYHQYHCCWCSGDTRSQGIRSNGINLVLPECSCLNTWPLFTKR